VCSFGTTTTTLEATCAVTGSAKIIGDAFIILNNDVPPQPYGGLKVIDTGSLGVTASFLWDGLNNHWVYENVSGSSYGAGGFLSGPRSTGIGNILYPTLNRITKGEGGDHITSSAILDDGTKVRIDYDLEVTGAVTASTFVGDLSGTASFATTSSFATNADILRGDFNTYTASTDSRLDGLSGLTGSYATTGSNTFIGNQIISGNVDASGIIQFNQSELGTNAEQEYISFGSTTQNGKTFGLGRVFAQNYPSFGTEYEDAYSTEFYDSFSYNYGTEFKVNGWAVGGAAVASGSGSPYTAGRVGTFRVTANHDLNKTFLIAYANDVQIGALSTTPTDRVWIGNTGSVDELRLRASGAIDMDSHTQVDITAPFVVVSSSLDVTGTVTASLSEGYMLVGNSAGRTYEVSTGSYATTGSNTFVGSQILSSSVQTEVVFETIASSTASIDFSDSSLFVLNLVSGSTTHITAANVGKGHTVNVLVQQPTVGFGGLTFSPDFLQISGSPYEPTQVASAKDILTLINFDSGSEIFVANIKNFV